MSATAFGNPEIIVRRGAVATFVLDVKLPAGQDASVLAAISVQLTDSAVGGRRNGQVFQPAQGGAHPAPGESTAKVESPTRVDVSIRLPDDIPVGDYHINFLIGGTPALTTAVKVLVLFNAWCTSADEYVPSSEAREEYVLLEDGLIHFGAWNSIGRSGWNYGQVRPPKLTVGFSHSSYIVMAYRVVGSTASSSRGSWRQRSRFSRRSAGTSAPTRCSSRGM
eukprot:COSAG03_NODE_74_length_14441_cov_13.158974_1_plen_222_part_00